MKSREKSRRRKWLLIAASAVLVHLLLFVGVRQSFFDVFRKTIDDGGASSGARASMPDAIVVVPVAVEGDEPVIEEIEENDPTPPAPPSEAPPTDGRDGPGEIDVENIMSNASPRPSEPSGLDKAVPPRPTEITWPQTKGLGHCLGLGINVRIRVSVEGEVLRVQAVDGGFPEDCVDAALDAARRIKFEPGKVKGRPAEMWTQVRMDFRRK